MNRFTALTAGMAGAASLNLVHEAGRNLIPNAPHVDLLAMRALGIYVLHPMGWKISLKALRRWAMAGDLLSNSLYYAAMLAAFKREDSKSIWRRALFFGVGAGATVVILPSFLRLGPQQTGNFPRTASLTVAWYSIGAFTAAAVYSILAKSPGQRVLSNRYVSNT